MSGRLFYEEPTVEIICVDVEAGFETSCGDDYGLPGEKPDVNDYGEF